MRNERIKNLKKLLRGEADEEEVQVKKKKRVRKSKVVNTPESWLDIFSRNFKNVTFISIFSK